MRRSSVGLLRAVVLGGLLLSAVLLVPASSSADVGERWARLTRLSDAVARGGMPLGYVPLRKLWAEWDQSDPQEVEESLHAIAGDTRIAAPLRTYAGLLEAYARRRRGDLSGAKLRVKELGFVDRWIVTGPFDNEGKNGLDRVFGPEEDIAEPLVIGRTYDGKERQVGHRITPDAFPYGWVDFGAMMRPEENVCAYATTFVRDPSTKTGARSFSIWFGASGAGKVFFDGVPVIKDPKYRDLDTDRIGAKLSMQSGWHRLTVKVCGDEDRPMFALRLADANGAPDKTLESDPDPSHAREAAATRFRKGEKPPAAELTGPVPMFDTLVRRDDAASLESYARWLVLTSSDDPADHRARDLARRAAEKSPTVARCLLAGDLAENRNQRAYWIDRAEDVIGRGGKNVSTEERIDALLARASHARGGANWRDAIPYYDKVLALDPDNVPANLAHVELYSEAGLRETALAFLDRTLERRPRSVALLRATAAALRDVERTTESEEVTARYATLRYDDTQVLSERIELALARRDSAAANRWIERLVETNPDSLRSLATAAKAYVALGDRAKAIAMPAGRSTSRPRTCPRFARSPTSMPSAVRRTSRSVCSARSSS